MDSDLFGSSCMSTATPFKFLGAFPFCAEHMTTSAIDALGFATYRGTLEDIMEKFWLVEEVALTAYGFGGDTDIDDTAPMGILGTELALEPSERVCRSEITPDDYFANDTAPIGGYVVDGEATVRLIFRRVVYDTDTEDFCLLMSLDAIVDDGTTKAATTDQNDPSCTLDATADSTIFGNSYPVKCDASTDFVMTAEILTLYTL